MISVRTTFAAACTLGIFSMTVSPHAIAQTPTAPAVIEFVTSQPMNQSRARVFLGADVTNPEGQIIGDINDLLFDKTGQISTAVIGVGGFLGLGEKSVAIPFAALTVRLAADGSRTIALTASKSELNLAPTFIATEKTTMDVVRDKAVDLGHKTADKANELKDQAVKKIDDMTKAPSNKN
jgi:sporulation protein YlmC with PRC-barrel domain